MKHFTKIVIFFFLFVFMSGFKIDLPKDKTEKMIVPTPKILYSTQQESLGKRMVKFIRKLLGDEPKKVDEKLVRDDV